MEQRARYTVVHEPGKGFLGRVAFWECDLRSGAFVCHGELSRVARRLGRLPASLAELMALVPQSEQGEFCEWLEAARSGRPAGPLEHHFSIGNGQDLLVGHVIDAVFRDGAVTHLQGIVVDLTEVRRLEQRSVQLGKAMEQAWEEIYLFDPETLRFVEVNATASRNTGYLRRELLRLTPLDLKREFSEPLFRRYLDELRSGRKAVVVFTTRHFRKDGSDYPVEVRLQFVSARGQQVFVATVSDLSIQETFHRNIDALKTRFEHVLESSPVVHYSFRIKGSDLLPTFFPARLREYGYDPRAVVGDANWWVSNLHPDDREDVLLALAATFADPGQRRHVQEYRFAVAQGGWRWIHDEMTVLRDESGSPVELVGSWLDVSEQRRLQAALEHRAMYDELTGLPNRALFHDRLDQAIHGAEERDEPLALLLVDMARLKEVNDSFGFDAGDQVLVEASARLLRLLGRDDTLARIGGDTFAVLLTKTGRKQAAEQANRILAAFSRPMSVGGQSLMLDAILGIALYPPDGCDGETLLSNADVALNAAKEEGLSLRFHDQVHAGAGRRRMGLAIDLRAALERPGDGLRLVVQPKVRIADDRVTGVEGLARWHHPELGEIPPDEFVPIAERSGLIQHFTGWVIEEALRLLQHWRRSELPLSLAINFSVLNLGELNLLADLKRRLEHQGVSPQWLEVEVTEMALMQHMEPARRALQMLKDIGVRVAIDDFGTGYSSLAYLRSLPVDELKIDASFVRRMDEEPMDYRLVQNIVRLGHDLGLELVAEGVENGVILAALRDLGCDKAQGYHIARPMPPTEFEAWLQALPRDGAGYRCLPAPGEGGNERKSPPT